jgi:hypothetical protein
MKTKIKRITKYLQLCALLDFFYWSMRLCCVIFYFIAYTESYVRLREARSLEITKASGTLVHKCPNVLLRM